MEATINDTSVQPSEASIEEDAKIQAEVAELRSWKETSTEARSELLQNLKEAIRLVQRHSMSSFISSVAFVALAWAPADVVRIDTNFLVPVSRFTGLMLLFAGFWVLGLLAALILARAWKILLLVKQSTPKQLIQAVLTYPSIPTMKTHGIRVGLAALPPIAVLAGLIKINGTELLGIWPLFGLLVSCMPHAVLAIGMRKSLGGASPDRFGD